MQALTDCFANTNASSPGLVAVDFETFYDEDYSLTHSGVYSYVSDVRFDPYLVALYGDGVEYVGPTREAPWHLVSGRPWWSHNAAFDLQVFMEAQRRGIIPAGIQPASWDCSADLSTFMKARRSLKEAAHSLLGVELEKETRNLMKGRTYEQARKDGLVDQLHRYALEGDAKTCWALARKFGPLWPEQEILMSRLNRKAGSEGVHVDQDALRRAVRSLQAALWTAAESIPWEWGGPDQNKTPLSLNKAREQCRVDGIPAPTTFREDSDEASEWEETYADKLPWIRAIRMWRKANRLLRALQTIESRLRSDGTFPYAIKYFGASTGRFSGSDGFNMQNLPRDPLDISAFLTNSTSEEGLVSEVDLRPLFVAPSGGYLGIVDLSQIEPRVLMMLAGDRKQLDLVRQGYEVYEAHARRFLGYDLDEPLKSVEARAKTDPQLAQYRNLRKLAKARVLGGGYGAGASKFQIIARVMAGLELSGEECQRAVSEYRADNEGVTSLWWRMINGLRCSAMRRENFTVTLPSGRKLEYFNPHLEGGQVMAQVERDGSFYKFFGGKLVENATQAVARDVFIEGLLRVEKKGIASLAFHVHDEGVWRISSPETLQALKECMKEPPSWWPDFPVDCDGVVSRSYTKP